MHLPALLLSLLLAAEPKTGTDSTWPPELKGAIHGTVTLSTPAFLEIPASIAEKQTNPESAPFSVAATPPVVELAFHSNLGPNPAERRLWSSWGDICVADDGRVYCGIGDHGDDVGGNARCFLYRWDPVRKVLEQVADMNQVVPPQKGQPAWSKIHAKVDSGTDGKIYFCCTLNDGNRAKLPSHGWTERLPGGQIYQFDPETGKTTVFANLPPRRCTATSLFDRKNNVWWCNLEAGEGNALWGFNLSSKRVVYQGEDGSVGFNRNFALLADGSILFNGPETLAKLDPRSGKIVQTELGFKDSKGMRASSRPTKSGALYGTTYVTNQLFRYDEPQNTLTMLGPTWLTGAYTTVMELSPDERFVYYLPGAHGGAFRDATPVVQYEITTGRRKVLAFLAPAFEQAHEYVPAGTYGMKLNSDGSTIYVNFNGHATERLRPKHRRADGFGLCAFAAIQIPASER